MLRKLNIYTIVWSWDNIIKYSSIHTKFIIHYSNNHINIFVCKFQDFNAKLLSPQALVTISMCDGQNTTNFYEYINWIIIQGWFPNIYTQIGTFILWTKTAQKHRSESVHARKVFMLGKYSFTRINRLKFVHKKISIFAGRHCWKFQL